MITKHGASLWSTRPPEGRFETADVSAEAAARASAHVLATDFAGTALIDGYTVAHDHGSPTYAAVVARTSRGERVAARGDDAGLAAAMVADEWCGREIQVRGSRFEA